MKPGKKADCSERMKSVEREYENVEIVLDALVSPLVRSSGFLTKIGLSAADIQKCQKNLHDTYFIRLFAAFETSVRDYWKNGLRRKPQVHIRDIIDSLASRHIVLEVVLNGVHRARKWRNRMIHEDDAEAEPVAINDARSAFGRFIGRLPDNW